MAKNFALVFYHSEKWKRCRNAYIQERLLVDGGLCEECHKEHGYIVHHTIILNAKNINNPEITLNPKHLKYVCKTCHDNYEGHGVGKKKKQTKARFDKNGEPIDIRTIPPYLKNTTTL